MNLQGSKEKKEQRASTESPVERVIKHEMSKEEMTEEVKRRISKDDDRLVELRARLAVMYAVEESRTVVENAFLEGDVVNQ
jgi:hypothetical protein